MQITRQIEEFEAVQYVGDNAEEIISFIGCDAKETNQGITVSGSNGEWYVYVDQWVLKTLDGEILGTIEKDHFWDSFATLDEPLG